MIDTRAVAQEVQDQLLAAMNKGQEQVRKAQEQMRQAQEQVRKSQEQVRKGREAVTGAIRTGNELAKAFRPNIPALPPTVRVPSLSKLTDPAKLRASAQQFADQMIATQRKVAGEVLASQRNLAGQLLATQRNLADKAFEAASPFVLDGVARLTKVVATLQDGRKSGHAHSAAKVEAAPEIAAAEVAKAPEVTH